MEQFTNKHFLKKQFQVPSFNKEFQMKAQQRGRSLDLDNSQLRDRLTKNNKIFLNRNNNETQHYKDIIPKVVQHNRSVSQHKSTTHNQSVILPNIHQRPSSINPLESQRDTNHSQKKNILSIRQASRRIVSSKPNLTDISTVQQTMPNMGTESIVPKRTGRHFRTVGDDNNHIDVQQRVQTLRESSFKEEMKTNQYAQTVIDKYTNKNQRLMRARKGNFNQIPQQELSSQMVDQQTLQSNTKDILEIQTVNDFIELIRQRQIHNDKFIYLIKKTDQYNLEIASYPDILADKLDNYYTMSCRGVSYFQQEVLKEFTYLGDWIKERDQYNTIIQFQFFQKFKKWKTLKKWTTQFYKEKFDNIRSNLQNNLFILHPIYQKILLKHKSICLEMEGIEFVETKFLMDTQTLEYFSSVQQGRRRQVEDELKRFSQKMHSNLKMGLQVVMEKLRKNIMSEINQQDKQTQQKTNDKTYLQQQSQIKQGNKMNVMEVMGFPEQLCYSHKSQLRVECQKILRLAYACDFIGQMSLQRIYENSINLFLKSLTAMEMEFTNEIQYLNERVMDRVQAQFKNNNKEETKKNKIELFKTQKKEPLFQVRLILKDVDQIKKANLKAQREEYTFIDESQIDDKSQHLEQILKFDLESFSQLKDTNKDVLDMRPEQVLEKVRQEEQTGQQEEEDKTDKQTEMTSNRYKRTQKSIEEELLEVSPKQEDFVKFFRDSLKEGIQGISVIAKFSKSEELLMYANTLEEWDEMIGGHWQQEEDKYLKPIIDLDLSYQQIESKIQRSFIHIQQLKIVFSTALQSHWRDIHTDLSHFQSGYMINRFKVQQLYNQALSQNTLYAQNILVPFVQIGLFRVDCQGLKSQVITVLKQLQANTAKLIQTTIQERAYQIKSYYSQYQQTFQTILVNSNDFVNQLKLTQQFFKDQDTVRQERDDIYDLIQNSQVVFNKEDHDRISELVKMDATLNSLYINIDSNFQKNQERFIKDLKEKKEESLLKLDDLELQVTDDKFENTIDQDEKTMIIELERVEEQLISESNNLTKNNYQVQVISQSSSPNDPQIDTLKQHVSLRLQLWKASRDWQTLHNYLYNSSLSLLDISYVQNTVNVFQKLITKCLQALPRANKVKALRDTCQVIVDLLPLLNALVNPHMGLIVKQQLINDHKQSLQITDSFVIDNANESGTTTKKGQPQVNPYRLELETLINRTLEWMNPDITIGWLLDIKITNHSNEIIEMSRRASEVKMIEECLEKEESKWSKVEMKYESWEESDIMVMTGHEAVLVMVEQSMTVLDSLLVNKYIGKLKLSVQKQLTLVTRLGDILETWVQAQKRWTYLHNIFSSDIKKQFSQKDIGNYEKTDKGMRKFTSKVQQNRKALNVARQRDTLETLKTLRDQLETVHRQLEEYLEQKRQVFPRLYFTSDDQLLRLIAEYNNQETLQTGLQCVFTDIQSVILGTEEDSLRSIQAVKSSQGEVLSLFKAVTMGDSVEIWFKELQESMQMSVNKQIRKALQELYDVKTKQSIWIHNHTWQSIQIASLIQWFNSTEHALHQLQEGKVEYLTDWYHLNLHQISELVDHLQPSTSTLHRVKLTQLIQQGVYLRDLVEQLVLTNCQSTSDYTWLQHMRYMMDESIESTVINQYTSTLLYGHEYLSVDHSPLVITPLTTKTFISINTAIATQTGALLQGSSNTAKTHTLTAIAHHLGQFLLIFNATHSLSLYTMTAFIQGLIHTGTWLAFSHIDRLSTTLLAVLAQQIFTIKQFKQTFASTTSSPFVQQQFGSQSDNDFEFEGKKVKVNLNCAIFATMTTPVNNPLPQNLKDFFRPVSIVQPDNHLIVSTILFSNGFNQYKSLSQRIITLYSLLNQQLSTDQHYHFAISSLKQILKQATLIKYHNTFNTEQESDIIIKSLLLVNMPKLLEKDQKKFKELIVFVFGQYNESIEKQKQSNTNEIEQIIDICNSNNYQYTQQLSNKMIELQVQLQLQRGVIVYGLSKTGKSVLIELTRQYLSQQDITIINPSSMTIDSLYGYTDSERQEWIDGILTTALRSKNQWILLDTSLQTTWLQPLDSVLSQHSLLSIGNGQNIKVNQSVQVLLEVTTLKDSCASTISRSGIVYLSQQDMQQTTYIKRLVQELNIHNPTINKHLEKYFLNSFDMFYDLLDKPDDSFNKRQDMNSTAYILKHYLQKLESEHTNEEQLKVQLEYVYSFSLIWGLLAAHKIRHQMKMKILFTETFRLLFVPECRSIMDFYLNNQNNQFLSWESMVSQKNNCLYIQTIESTRIQAIGQVLLEVDRTLLLTGNKGVGKSHLVMDMTSSSNMCINISISYRSTSTSLQKEITNRLHKKSKSTYGVRGGGSSILIIDDIYLGQQSTTEWIRVFLERGMFYEDKEKKIEDTKTVLVTSGEVSNRLKGHTNVIRVETSDQFTLNHIYQSVLSTLSVSPQITKMSEQIAEATVELYIQLSKQIKQNTYLTYTQRDIKRGISAMAQLTGDDVSSLWFHEMSRLFRDRLNNQQDKQVLDALLEKTVEDIFKVTVQPGDLYAYKDNQYQKVNGTEIDGFKGDKRQIEQVYKIRRILRLPGEHLLLLGNEGIGKHSLVQTAARLDNQTVFYVSNGPPQVILNRKTKNTKSDATRHTQDILKAILYVINQEDKAILVVQQTDLIQHGQVIDHLAHDLSQLIKDSWISALTWRKDDYDQVLNAVRQKDYIQDHSSTNLHKEAVNIIQRLLQIVIIGAYSDDMQTVINRYPILATHSYIINIQEWHKTAYVQEATQLFQDYSADIQTKQDKQIQLQYQLQTNQQQNVIKSLYTLHEIMQLKNTQYNINNKQNIIISPKNFIQFVQLFQKFYTQNNTLLNQKMNEIQSTIDKLQDTQQQISQLENTQENLQPSLESESKKGQQMLYDLSIERENQSKKQAIVDADQAVCDEYLKEIQILQDEVQRALDRVQPQLEQASLDLEKIPQNEIKELMSIANFPLIMQLVFEAINTILKQIDGKDNVRKTILSPNLIQRLQTCDRENFNESQLKKLQLIIFKPEFDPEIIGQKSIMCKILAEWAQSMEQFLRINKEQQSKKQKIKEMQQKHQIKIGNLMEKVGDLNEQKQKTEAIQKEVNASNDEQQRVINEIKRCKQRMLNADLLMKVLNKEPKEWEKKLKKVKNEIDECLNVSLLNAIGVAYLGPYEQDYRNKAIEQIIDEMRWSLIPTKEYTNNTSILTNGGKIIVLVDPQDLSKNIIQEIKQEYLQTDYQDNKYLAQVQQAAKLGQTIIITNITGSQWNKDLQSIVTNNSHLSSFKLILITQQITLQTSYYLRTTVVNCSITKKTLSNTLMDILMQVSNQDLYQQKTKLDKQIEKAKQEIIDKQQQIILIMNSNEFNILDEEATIKSLDEIKKQIRSLETELKERKTSYQGIEREERDLIPVIDKSSRMYLTWLIMQRLNSQYLYSLPYFLQLFTQLATTDKHTIYQGLYSHMVSSIYTQHLLIWDILLDLYGHTDDLRMLIEHYTSHHLHPIHIIDITSQQSALLQELQNRTGNSFLVEDVKQSLSTYRGYFLGDNHLPDIICRIHPFHKTILCKALQVSHFPHHLLQYRTSLKQDISVINLQQTIQDTQPNNPLLLVEEEDQDVKEAVLSIANRLSIQVIMMTVYLDRRLETTIEKARSEGQWIVISNLELLSDEQMTYLWNTIEQSKRSTKCEPSFRYLFIGRTTWPSNPHMTSSRRLVITADIHEKPTDDTHHLQLITDFHQAMIDRGLGYQLNHYDLQTARDIGNMVMNRTKGVMDLVALKSLLLDTVYAVKIQQDRHQVDTLFDMAMAHTSLTYINTQNNLISSLHSHINTIFNIQPQQHTLQAEGEGEEEGEGEGEEEQQQQQQEQDELSLEKQLELVPLEIDTSGMHASHKEVSLFFKMAHKKEREDRSWLSVFLLKEISTVNSQLTTIRASMTTPTPTPITQLTKVTKQAEYLTEWLAKDQQTVHSYNLDMIQDINGLFTALLMQHQQTTGSELHTLSFRTKVISDANNKEYSREFKEGAIGISSVQLKGASYSHTQGLMDTSHQQQLISFLFYISDQQKINESDYYSCPFYDRNQTLITHVQLKTTKSHPVSHWILNRVSLSLD